MLHQKASEAQSWLSDRLVSGCVLVRKFCKKTEIPTRGSSKMSDKKIVRYINVGSVFLAHQQKGKMPKHRFMSDSGQKWNCESNEMD